MLEHASIRRILPGRHPILLVDRVLELVPFERIVAIKTVSGSEPCYARIEEDADDRAFAYPQSLIIESFGQSGALLWLESLRSRGQEPPGTLVFAAARDIAFRRRVYPGDTLRHEARIDHIIGDNAFFTGATYLADELVATVGQGIAAMRRTAGLMS
jgi:3-hydroxyacyl-[acyl-carrier-protein] dehydratase